MSDHPEPVPMDRSDPQKKVNFGQETQTQTVGSGKERDM